MQSVIRALLLWAVASQVGAEPVAREQPSAPPPRDAVVLFAGESVEAFALPDGQPCPWRVVDGAMEVRGGNIVTRAEFGDCQLHLEFWIPDLPGATGQAKGNSGVYLHGLYEVQILDSFGLESRHNDCGAIYEVAAPLVNACLPPETWQTYDILFRAPRFDEAGQLTEPPRLSVFQNGLLIQHNVAVPRPTRAHLERAPAPRGPLMLQDHGCAVRYRNIWLRPLTLK